MKIMILGDLHFGAKQDNVWIQNIQRDAIKQAITHSKSLGITQWIQTGDWFDVRKAVTHKTMEFNREIVQMIRDAEINVHVIVGNHDMNLKQKIHPNACTELLTQFDNFTVFDKITTVKYDDVKFDLTPWICDENQSEIMNHIEKSDSLYNIGHYELVGFYFYKGLKSHGSDPAFLRRYKKVISGHYHTESESRNVLYTGTPYTLTAGDENDIRGFRIFDTETHEFTYIENETIWHRRIDYPCSINPEMYRNLSVRVFVNEIDKNFVKFETALEAVVHEMKSVVKVDYSTDDSTEVVDTEEVKSLPELIEEHINLIPDINKLDATMAIQYSKELYMEATK